MAWSFRKRIKIVPGVTLNLNKGMPSVSVGSSPASVNIGRNARATASIPGSGLSASKRLTRGRKSGGNVFEKIVKFIFTMIGLYVMYLLLRSSF